MKQAKSKYKIYSRSDCGFCHAAKELLESKGLEYEEVDIDSDQNSRVMLKAKGFKTVPVIYLGEDHIGGYTDLKAKLVDKTIPTDAHNEWFR